MGSFSEYADEVRRKSKATTPASLPSWPPPTELERLPDWVEPYLEAFDAYLRGDAAARGRMQSLLFGNNPGLSRERVPWDRREAA